LLDHDHHAVVAGDRGELLKPLDPRPPVATLCVTKSQHLGTNFCQTEHDELFASIRNGKPINNGEYMAKSTVLAIMGRLATYTGQAIAWEQAMNSKEDLTPASYDWGALPTPSVAMPGLTKFA
jgi:hypothetical protein